MPTTSTIGQPHSANNSFQLEGGEEIWGNFEENELMNLLTK